MLLFLGILLLVWTFSGFNKEGALFGLIVGVFFIQYNYKNSTHNNLTPTYSTEKINIYSLKTDSSDISGSFYLGSGIIKTTPQYSMFIDSEENSKVKHFVPAKALIFEGDYKPLHEKTTCVDGLVFDWLKGMSKTIECEFYRKDKLYVPEGTITMKFNI